MNIEISKIPALLALLSGSDVDEPAAECPMFGEYVIVRSRDSGVHFGVMAGLDGRHVTLTNSRRLWYWRAAKEHTLSAVSLHGLGSGSKIASEVSRIDILDACEVIPCSQAAAESIKGHPSHDPS